MRPSPSYPNPQREVEDRAWQLSGPRTRARPSDARGDGGIMTDLQSKLGEMFGDKQAGQLPLYKDKPYTYASAKKRTSVWTKSRGWIALGAGCWFILYVLGVFSSPSPRDAGHLKGKPGSGWFSSRPTKDAVDWDLRREIVTEAFKQSWDAYERYAWGYDVYRPVSKKGEQLSPRGMGWVIVDALDTLVLMNLTTRLTHARQWLSTELNYDQNVTHNTFEMTSHLLGGLLSAHYLSNQYPDMAPIQDDDEGAAGEDLYLEKAKDLADRLVGAFDTPSGVPTVSVDLAAMKGSMAGAQDGTASSAEVASLALEFKYLSKVTGEAFYWEHVEKVMETLDAARLKDGLAPARIDPSTGTFRGDAVEFGTHGTSVYEHMLKQYLQTLGQEPVYEALWNESLHGIEKHLTARAAPSGLTVLGKRPNGLNGGLSPQMDHSDCSLPGMMALSVTGGARIDLGSKASLSTQQQAILDKARRLMQTCWTLNTISATGLAADAVTFDVDEAPVDTTKEDAAAAGQGFKIPQDQKSHHLPSQTVESLFYLWRITGDVTYREWAWQLFDAMLKHAVVANSGGFSGLSDATTTPATLSDSLEKSWMPATLKYFYLLFSPEEVLPLQDMVMNTAGHVLPRFKMAPLFSTGWQRRLPG